MAVEDGDTPFWRFSVSAYESPDVSGACLALQDRFGADVNLLLLCCWLGLHGVSLDQAGIARLNDLVKAWRDEVVVPLRSLRRRLKTALGVVLPDQSAAVREAVKSVELDAERIEQEVLYRALESLPGRNAQSSERVGVARLNLVRYFQVIEIEPAGPVRDGIEALLAGVVASLPAGQAVSSRAAPEG